MQPSERFAITQSSSLSASLRISPHGKLLISNELERICDCLASLIVSECGKENGGDLLNMAAPLIKAFDDSNIDAQFSMQIAQRLTSEMCSLAANYNVCRHFISTNIEAVLFNVLAALLDPSRLEIFPSCNIERIEAGAGELASQQALTLLDLFNDDAPKAPPDNSDFRELGVMASIQQRRRHKADQFWELCDKLGSAFTRLGHSEVDDPSSFPLLTVGAALLESDNDLPRRPPSFSSPLSLESETAKCFQLLRGIISACSTKRGIQNRITSERLASFTVGVIASHILRIVQSLKYYDQTCSSTRQATTEEAFRRAKLTELLSSFSELFIAVLTWILREMYHSGSTGWHSLLAQARDRLINPILRREHVDLTDSLQQIVLASKCVLTGTHSRNIATRGILGCSKYLDEMFDCLVRRSRQLIVAAVMTPQHLSLQSSLVEAVIAAKDQEEEDIACYVGSSFNPGISQGSRQPFRSPLHKEVDQYIRYVEQELQGTSPLCDNMNELIFSFLNTFVVSRLNHTRGCLQAKRRMLRLVHHILSTDISPFDLSDYSSILCSLVKGVCASLVQCLGTKNVDDAFICVAFTSSTNLAKLNIANGEGQHLSLISWIRHLFDTSVATRSLVDLSIDEMRAAYLWAYFKWFQEFASIIVFPGNSGMEKLLGFRKKYSSESRNDQDTTGCLGTDVFGSLREQKDFVSWDMILNCLENELFPPKNENNPNIVNVYARTKTDARNDDAMMNWSPSSNAKRTAKEYMAEVI